MQEPHLDDVLNPEQGTKQLPDLAASRSHRQIDADPGAAVQRPYRRPSFSELHNRPLPLIVPTAWDVGSALTLVEAGFQVIGTTSFGTTAAAGGPPQPRIRSRLTERLIAHLAQLPIHLTADIENGYFDDPQQVADYAAALPVAGVDLADRSPHTDSAGRKSGRQDHRHQERSPRRLRERSDRDTTDEPQHGNRIGLRPRLRLRRRRSGRGLCPCHPRPSRDPSTDTPTSSASHHPRRRGPVPTGHGRPGRTPSEYRVSAISGGHRQRAVSGHQPAQWFPDSACHR